MDPAPTGLSGPSHAVIAADLIAFRLAGFASTHAHDNCRPDFLQRREMFAHCFQRGPETPYEPRPPRGDIHQTSTNTLGVRFFAPRLRRSLGLPCPHFKWPRLPRSSDISATYICFFVSHRVFWLACASLLIREHGLARIIASISTSLTSPLVPSCISRSDEWLDSPAPNLSKVV